MVTTVPATPEDDVFLYDLYAGTRREELDAWGWDEAQRQLFLTLQWNAQRMSYASRYPEAVRYLVRQAERNIGQLYLDCRPDGWRIIDVSLLPEYRGRGIGSELLRDLQRRAASAGAPICLSVQSGSPAKKLYERLGFRLTAVSEPYSEMAWTGD
ncbi:MULTISPECIES: GNAT family N-acetyltransferase [Saccharibacillus]|uniref:GNAT family N-acetyltransferase n=1 Tax=Saccharibacillus TaxID=456492 RepID=UPI00123BC307|nr:GNAT family N-acetyltransferase [Saccharibacillus sp. WB 17]MWJ31403.1 GNAT family N-acetyltransferase [Saccharibacillus sp. WB 17]